MNKVTIILCLVFVISISLVACFAFVPMSAKRVASADVSSLEAEAIYFINDIEISDLPYYGSYSNNTTNNTSYGLPFRKYSSYPDSYIEYTYMETSCTQSNGVYTSLLITWFRANPSSYTGYLCFVAGNIRNTYHFPADGWYYGNWSANADWDRHYSTMTPLEAEYFADNQSHVLEFVNAPTAVGSNSCFNVLKDIFSVSSLDAEAPTYDDFVNINYVSVVKDDGVDTVNFVNNLVLLELDNAYRYQSAGSTYNYVNLKVVYHFDDDTSLSQSFNIFSDGILTNRYYLLLAAPHDISDYYTFNGNTTLFSTKDCVAIDISYDDSPNITTFSETYNPAAFTIFQNNFTWLMRSGTMYQAFWAGYNYGVVNSRLSGNNLQTLLWTVFSFPFKILFGEYDNNIGSDTYGEYVGGLFNVTILGMDMRAFLLSVVSLCVVIGIVKIVLGFRGVKG